MAKEIKDLRSDVENLRSAIASMAAGNALDPGKTKLFPDIPENHWAYDEIAQLYGNGIVKGYPDGRFDGDRMMTRYEFASLVYEQMQKGAALSNRVVTEFMPELERIRVDTVAKTRDGRPAIQRVRVSTQVAYGMYENGKRRLPICGLITLARFYDVSADYILGLTDHKEKK